MKAVIYIGHGNRSPIGRKAYEVFIKNTMEATEVPIKEYCYYERAEPTLTMSIENCIDQGATEILVIPVLLLSGKQTTEEIPKDLQTFKENYPGVSIRFGKPIGEDPLLLDIVYDRLKREDFLTKEAAAVILVSHGSHDPLASQEFKSIASALSKHLNVSVETGYLVTEPNYLKVINQHRERRSEKIFVIPYFFFAGVFLEEMKEATFGMDEVVVCDELGYDDDIIRLLVERAKG